MGFTNLFMFGIICYLFSYWETFGHEFESQYLYFVEFYDRDALCLQYLLFLFLFFYS
jgi:hypothetical protein